ncbi:(2Fe-2S)-binding protein [Methylococcus sp. EFPC2]|nr:(2Fe-2S)-binding protein [Methylococcus sp. EFPC2]
MITLTINGKRHSVDLPGDTPLLWTLRDHLGLTGTKYGCGIAQCGACTVHIDGQPAFACITPIASLAGKNVVTIEAIGDDPTGNAIQEAWLAQGVPQCGYCQPGQVMAATALLKRTPKPSDADIDAAMSGNICRCGTYPRIRAAIKLAAGHTGHGTATTTVLASPPPEEADGERPARLAAISSTGDRS